MSRTVYQEIWDLVFEVAAGVPRLWLGTKQSDHEGPHAGMHLAYMTRNVPAASCVIDAQPDDSKEQMQTRYSPTTSGA